MLSVASKISAAENLFVEFKRGWTGSGYTALINCIFALDTPHREKMAKGFPELVNVVNRYNNERGYWKDLIARYNEENGTQLVP